jgi:hypothetical protein
LHEIGVNGRAEDKERAFAKEEISKF